jgi:hypothetical protein
VKIEVNDKEVVAHLGEFTYGIGNFEDADDLLNCSPNAIGSLLYSLMCLSLLGNVECGA